MITGYHFAAGDDDVPMQLQALSGDEHTRLLIAAKADRYMVGSGAEFGRLSAPWNGHPAGAAAFRFRRRSGASQVIVLGEREG